MAYAIMYIYNNIKQKMNLDDFLEGIGFELNPKRKLLAELLNKTCKGDDACLKKRYSGFHENNNVFCIHNCPLPKCKNYFFCNNYIDITDSFLEDYEGSCDTCSSKFNSLALSFKANIECPICFETNVDGISGIYCKHYHCFSCFRECHYPKTKKRISLIEPKPNTVNVYRRISFDYIDDINVPPVFPVPEKKEIYETLIQKIMQKYNISRKEYYQKIINIIGENIYTKEFPNWIFQYIYRSWENDNNFYNIVNTDISVEELKDYDDDETIDKYCETMAKCSLCRQDITSRKRDKKPWQYYDNGSNKKAKPDS